MPALSRTTALVEGSTLLAVFVLAAHTGTVQIVSPVALLAATGLLWLRGQQWRALGLRRTQIGLATVARAAALAAALLLLGFFAIIPVAERLTGAPLDFALFRKLPGDPGFLALMLTLSWTYAAFGEEMLFRGFAIDRLWQGFGRSRSAACAAAATSSIAFGVSHAYQGPAGMLATGVIGAGLAAAYLRSGRNLWLVILAHGLVDTAVMLGFYTGLLT